MSPLWIAPAAIGGALLGPFLRGQIFYHSVEYGNPWRHECPHCSHDVLGTGARGLTSVLPATGRCPACLRRLGPAPGIVEATAAAVVALLTWRITEPLPWLACCWTFLIGVALAHIDVVVHRLPDRLSLTAAAGAAVLLIGAAVTDHRYSRLVVACVCAVGVALFYLILVLANPSGMGLGDAKTAISTGLVTGWFSAFAAIAGGAAGFVLAGMYALALIVSRRAGPKDHIPHGPFLLLGAVATVALLGS